MTEKSKNAVVKDGAELGVYKSLSSAKKKADEKKAEVISEDGSVYAGAKAAGKEPPLFLYRLLATMHVRKAPSLEAEKAGIARCGAIIKVRKIENDWMHLANGTFILFGEGTFAERVEEE